MAPTIGITTYHTNANWRGWSEEGALLPWTYVKSIRNNGGRPVLLPPGGDVSEAEATVAVLDGIVIAGGGDINPAIYGAIKHEKTDVNAPDRDSWELAVAEAAVRQGVPLLGICRGAHKVRVTSGTIVASILPGGEFFEVPTHHHQAVDLVGAGLTAVAWADDGIVEAIESTTQGEFLVGVQWHPEQGDDPRLFGALITAAEMHYSERTVASSLPPLLAGA
jgi:gamma-glutamyl-gamma-aminobutyrate hydrolase PuuD